MMTQGKSQNEKTLKEQIIDNNHLFDDASLVIRDHGVVRAVEGLDVADLAGDDGEAHPVLGGDVPGHVGGGIYPPLHPVGVLSSPDPSDPDGQVVAVHQVVAGQRLHRHQQPRHQLQKIFG